MNSYPLPTEKAVQHWAQQGEAELLSLFLDTLNNPDAGINPELLEKIRTAELRYGLTLIFQQSLNGLSAAYETRPDITRPGSEVTSANLGKGREQAGIFEHAITDYVMDLSNNTERAHEEQTDEARPPAQLLQAGLGDAGNHKLVYACLAGMETTTRQWLIAQSAATVGGVKERLWLVVGSTRDFAAVSSRQPLPPAALEEHVRAWSSDIDAGFGTASQEIMQALDWLSNTDSQAAA